MFGDVSGVLCGMIVLCFDGCFDDISVYWLWVMLLVIGLCMLVFIVWFVCDVLCFCVVLLSVIGEVVGVVEVWLIDCDSDG